MSNNDRHMPNIQTQEDAELILRQLGLFVGEEAIRAVVKGRQSGSSKYVLSGKGKNRDGSERKPICARGTVDKIDGYLVAGHLDNYVSYLRSIGELDPVVDDLEGDSRPEIEQEPEESLEGGKAEEILHSITDYQIAHFFGGSEIGRIRSLLDAERDQGSYLLEYLEGLSKTWDDDPSIPDSWLSVIAGFPIVSRHIGAPALEAISRVILEKRPFAGRTERKHYHSSLRSHLKEAFSQISQWAMPSGYLFLPQKMKPLRRLNSLEEICEIQLTPEEERILEDQAEESLMGGKLILARAEWVRVPLENTIAGLVWDMFLRLPDVDRRKGKVLPKKSIKELFVDWSVSCSQAEFDHPRPADS